MDRNSARGLRDEDDPKDTSLAGATCDVSCGRQNRRIGEDMRCQNELDVVLESRCPRVDIGEAGSAGQEHEFVAKAASLREDETDRWEIVFGKNDLAPPAPLRQRKKDFRVSTRNFGLRTDFVRSCADEHPQTLAKPSDAREPDVPCVRIAPSPDPSEIVFERLVGAKRPQG